MAQKGEPAPSAPPLRPPPVLFPLPPGPATDLSPAGELLVGRLRRRSREASVPDVEGIAVVLESLLPNLNESLEKLIASQRAEGAELILHWRLTSSDLGHGAHEIGFEPAGEAGHDATLIATGSYGQSRVEVSLLLAHANPAEQEGLRAAMKKAGPFKLIVLSHEVDVE